MNAKAFLMTILAGVLILVISHHLTVPMEIISFSQETLVYDVSGTCYLDMGLTEINAALFRGYYQSSDPAPIEEPWNTYTRSYNYCYLNGYEGVPQVNQYGAPWCRFTELPIGDSGSCYGQLTFSVLPLSVSDPDPDPVDPVNPTPPNPDDSDKSILDKIIDTIAGIIVSILSVVGLIK